MLCRHVVTRQSHFEFVAAQSGALCSRRSPNMSIYFVDLKRRREQEEREEAEESEEKEEKSQKVRDLNALLELRIRHAEEARRKRPGPKGPKRRPRTLFDWADHDYVLSERDYCWGNDE